MKALVFERSLPRFAAARLAGSLVPGKGAKVGPLSLDDIDPPAPPGPQWQRVRPRLAGICGSDLATIDGAASRYFEPIVSFPFVPGHEIVGELDDGTRVVVVPILTCAVRGIDPPCHMCGAGRENLCERTAFGVLEPGLQTGYCESTGGGWATSLVAHEHQLVHVPHDLGDEAAVMIEPAACAVHAARAIADDEVAVIGSGTVGLLTIAALRRIAAPRGPLIATAKHPDQKRLAKELGADVVVDPGALGRAIRSATGSLKVDERLTCGIDVVVDCVGSEASLSQALDVVAPGGTILAVGMPSRVSLELTGLWHREVNLRGCYAYTRGDVEAAVDLVRDADLGRLVSATYPLDRYQEAIEHAADAGRRGAVKIAFDLRNEKERSR